MALSKQYLKDLVYQVNGASIEIHKALGPGLLESVYHRCMAHELSLRGISFKSELGLAVNYKDIQIDTLLRCDFLIEDTLVVELKAVETIMPIHIAQILTYMKLLKKPMGLMLNFNCSHMYSEGQKTYVNELYQELF
ncbi:GxxExxY protein [Pedobacter sp. UYP30]|uniref:GxxExxY protein n=1 Tax=Pedobacter sp. UYP30 TaxID=1756400 RepID=UPI003391F7D2